MPTQRPRPDETREMRLFSKVIELQTLIAEETESQSPAIPHSRTLAEFIARRRAPGETQRSWDELRYELRDVTGEIVSDQSIRSWAARYGIPERAEANEENYAKRYARALEDAGITI